MTVPYCTIRMLRRGYGCKLSSCYFLDGAAYCAAAAREMGMPDLFGMVEGGQRAGAA